MKLNLLNFKCDSIRHLQKMFGLLLILFYSTKAHAQHPLGLMVGDFNSPYSFSLNPALARTNPGNRAYVNWWGASLNLENNFMKYNAPIRMGAWIREDYPAEYTNINGSLAFQQNWLPVDKTVQNWKLNYLNEVYSPSFFFPIDDVGAFGFGVKSVSGFSINGLNPQFGSVVRYGMPEIQSQIGNTINQSEFSINTEKYQEWFFTFAGYDNPSKIHSWRWGVTAKMLLGMGVAHLGSDNLSFDVVDDKTININQLNSRLYYSAGSMRTMQHPFGLKFDWVEGVGLGTDLGVMYEYRPKALKYKGFDWCESEKNLAYSWKFGMSITDLGFISYWGNSSNITSLGNQNWTIDRNIIQNGQFTTGDEKLQDLSQKLFEDLGADQGSEFLSYSPAALNIQYDKAINQNLHVGAYWTQSLKGRNSVGLRRASYLSVVPRWQSERIEIGLPLTLANDYTAQHVGIYARFGPFIAGTDNLDGLGKFLANDNYSGGSFYFGFRSKIGGCDRPRNKKYSVIQHETYNDTQIKRDTIVINKVITDTLVKTERKTQTITKQVIDTVYQTNRNTVTLPVKNNAQIELVKVKEDLQKSQSDLGKVKADLNNAEINLQKSQSDLGKVKADLTNTQNELGKVRADLANSNLENQKNKAEITVLKDQNNAKDAEIARIKADLLSYTKKCDEDKKALQDYLDKIQLELAKEKQEKAKIVAENDVLKNQVNRLSAATVGLSCEKQLKSMDSALIIEKTKNSNAQIEIVGLKNKSTQQDAELIRLKSQIDALNKEKALLNDQIALLEAQRKLCQSELDKTKSSTQSQIDLVNQNNDLKLKLANAEKQLLAINLEKENCNKQLAAIALEKENLNKQLAAVKSQLEICSKNTGGSSIDAENCKKQLTALQAEKTSLETKNAQLTAQVQSLTAQINSLNSQINAANAQINTLKGEATTNNSKINALNEQIKSLNAQISTLTAQVSSLTTQNNALSTQVSTLTSQNAALTVDKKACEEKLAKTSSSITVSEDCTPYKNKVKELELKTAELEGKNKTLESQNVTLTTQNANLQASIKSSEATIAQIKANLQKQTSEIETIKSTSSKCESEKLTLSAQLEAAKKKISELEASSTSNTSSELTAQLNTLNAQVSSLKEQLQNKEAQLQTSSSKIASLEAKIASLEKQLSECNSLVSTTKTDLDECLKAKSILEGDESRLRKQIIQMDEDMGKLSEIIKSNSAEISKLKAENSALNVKLKECQTKLNPTPEAP